jgi:predicted esterase
VIATLWLSSLGAWAPPAPVAGDAGQALLAAVEQEWAALEGRTLEQQPYRDKRRFLDDLPAWLERERVAERELRGVARTLERRAQREDTAPGLAWRLHELRARVLASVDAAGSLAARADAVASYPDLDYADPRRHSSFQHLAAEWAGALWALEGRPAAEELLRAVLWPDARLDWFAPEPFEGLYLRERDLAGLEDLAARAAEALAERVPEAAQELRSYRPPDARFVADDGRRMYLVLGAEAEAAGPRDLVVVLPGGSGQALEFRDWLRELAAPLYDRYLFAVLSAPVWSAEQAGEVVWVTERHRRRYDAEFAVEDFARRVAADLRRAEPTLDQSFLCAWSSGGPAAYSTVLDRDATFAGAYILASVFKPETLDLRRAAGRRFFLEQGRDDAVTALRFAVDADQRLRDRGAEVRLEVFDGGHGFAMEDPATSFARALDWLSAGAR